MSRRRRARPHEVAKVDQAMAEVREQSAADPSAVMFAYTMAEPGVQCCWCDCTVEAHNDADCHGCPQGADWLAHLLQGGTTLAVYELCNGHRADFIETYAATLPNVQRAELVRYVAYDDDIED